MKIIDEIKKFKTRYDYGKIGNGTLYEMCKKYPYHKDTSEIIGKVWLIGRSYAVPLERNKNNKNVSDDFYNEIVAPNFKLGNFDNLLRDVRKLRGLSESDIPVIIETHKNVVDFIHKSITKDDKRSFSSKYLHFHFPKLFFIYDSRAAGAINQVISDLGSKKEWRQYVGNIKKHDMKYAEFFAKCFYFWKFCKESKTPLTIRQVDSFLVESANKILRNKKANKKNKKSSFA